jgi:hypothetical protein
MDSAKLRSQGFTLIAALLLLLLMSGIAIGLLLMVNTESRAGGNDLENNLAYHSAEGAIEKMTSDLANTFQSIQAPSAGNITNLAGSPPVTPGVTYPDYSLTPNIDPKTGNLVANYGIIHSGPNQGLFAQIIPVTLKATAMRPLGDEVSMVRTVEVALIPVFQFGVFSETDLAFFNSPNLDFAGRVHTNGDLYMGVASGYTITFHDKVTAYGNVIRQVLPNGLDATAYSDTGTVNVLTGTPGCSTSTTNCRTLAITEGSVVKGPTSAQNTVWPSLSQGNYNGWILDGNYGNPGGTGVKKLSLPFTSSGTQPYEIIRRPPAGETPTTGVGQSRLYNEAEVRVLLADDPAELPGGAADANNIRLANLQTNALAPNYSNGVPTSVPGALPVLASKQPYKTYFAEASTAIPETAGWTNTSVSMAPDWPTVAPSTAHTLLQPPGAPILTTGAAIPALIPLKNTSGAAYPYYTPPAPANTSTWNLIDGYLRVEYRDVNGIYHPVTQEWLQLGFARGTTPPVTAGSNPVNPNAVLIFQQAADRDGDGVADPNGIAPTCNSKGVCSGAKPPEIVKDGNTSSPFYGDGAQATSVTRNNWYPINFYDAREGEVRDTVQPGCTPNGIMNAVELDVGNLRKWLAGNLGGSGAATDWAQDNGYILYFSDRRGMLKNPNGTQTDPVNTKTGDSGLEDSINAASAAGTPDGALEPPIGANSPEDVNGNGKLDNWGAVNIGDGFNVNTSAPVNQYGPVRIASCTTSGRPNWVSGARHVLKLVDGTLGNLPVKPDGTGGFTVASENPVYIFGDYNTSATDLTWGNPKATDPPHAAAGVIADAVTLLSNNWSDTRSLVNPTGATGGRPALTTYYRVAIAAGKNKTFPAPAYTQNGTLYGFGTDGGLHNFLRFLEDWSGQTLNYKGSLVSLYYSTYNTGTFKCCGDAVYHPPTRNYIFDPLFAQPVNMPPGTPMFRDVDNLSYRQDFTPH